MKEFRDKLKLKLLPLLGWGLISTIGHTIRYRVTGFERVQGLIKSGQGFIMAVWHGRTLLPVYYCRGMGIWAITSLSSDGELQTRTISRLGYRIIRGSSARGGIKAALTACKKLEEGGILAITPDGPRGPHREVQEGTVFLAKRTGCPIIPIGVGANPRKLLSAWDEYTVPHLFARVSLVFGEPVYLSSDEEHPSQVLKAALDAVQSQAEQEVKEGC